MAEVCRDVKHAMCKMLNVAVILFSWHPYLLHLTSLINTNLQLVIKEARPYLIARKFLYSKISLDSLTYK